MAGYLLPFEIVSVHLLVVLIGAAYVARLIWLPFEIVSVHLLVGAESAAAYLARHRRSGMTRAVAARETTDMNPIDRTDRRVALPGRRGGDVRLPAPSAWPPSATPWAC